MTPHTLVAAALVVLAIASVGTAWLVFGDVNGDVNALGFVAWVVLPYGLAAVATRGVRSSRAASAVLLAAWVLVGGLGLWFTLTSTVWSVSDMSPLVLMWIPIVQIPVVLLAALGAWLLRRRELSS